MIRGLALCAGAGGLELGLGLALGRQYRTIGFVEREVFAASLLVARMEEKAVDSAPIWDDLSTFDGLPWRGRVDIVSAGYPCQPFSTAGRQAGEDDSRNMWPQVRRILEEVRPPLAFCENVSNHLHLGFSAVLDDLQSLGYQTAATLLAASEVGAPHKRQRLFFLAKLADPAGLESGESAAGNGRPGARGRGGEVADSDRPGQHPDGRPVLKNHRGDLGGGGEELADLADPGGLDIQQPIGPPRPRDAEETRPPGGHTGHSGVQFLPCFPPRPGDRGEWARIIAADPSLCPSLEPSVCGMDDGVASRVDRLRTLGNGVVPLAAAYAFRILAARLES